MAYTTPQEYKQWWKKKYLHQIGQFYSNYFCHCSSKCSIKIRRHHCDTGIPQYLKGHAARDGKSPMLRDEVKKKISDAHKGHSHLQTGLSIEIMKFRKGVVVPGPDYYKTFNDLVREGARLYEMSEGAIRRSILRILELKNLKELDIVILLNFIAGHNFLEISERYYLSDEDVIDSLRKVEKTWPGIMMSERTVPGSNQMLSFDILYHWAWEIIHKF